jgi:predicted PurR-regulated permease PerM
MVEDRQVVRWAALGTLGVLIVLLAGYGIYVVRGVLVLIFIALFLAVSLDPPVRWLIGKGLRRSIAVTIVMSILVALFGLFLWSMVPPLVDQGGNLVDDLPDYLRRLSADSAGVREVTDRYNLTDRLESLLGAIPARLASGAAGSLQHALSLGASLLTVLVLTIYIMADLPRLREGLVRLFPPGRRPQIAQILDVVVDKVGGYMIGNIVVSLFAGAAAFGCLRIAQVPFALPLAVIVAITDLIPMVGASFGAAICVIVSVFAKDIWPTGVLVLIFFIVYQQVENYLIAPRVLRNAVALSAMGVLVSALIGGALLGLVGTIMAIPIAATIKVLASRTSSPEPSPGPLP